MNKIKNRGPGSQQAALAVQLQQNDVGFMRKLRTKQNPQTLRRAAAANYRVLGVTPMDTPLMSPNTIHGPTDQKTVS